MSEILKKLLAEEVYEYKWIEHEKEIQLGPFHFRSDLPIPVAGNSEIHIALPPWFDVPYKSRGPVPMGHDDDEEIVNGEELLTAFLGGHFPVSAPDYKALVDHVGRCLLLIALMETSHKFHDRIINIIEQVEDGSAIFDNLVRLGKANIDDGSQFAEQGSSEDALSHYIVAFAMLNGAQLISPASAGVLYNLGLLCYDLAHRFSLPDEKLNQEWKVELSSVSKEHFQNSLADPEIQSTTPAFYLLGVCRETLREYKEAVSAYDLFLRSEAAENYPEIKKYTEKRKSELMKI